MFILTERTVDQPFIKEVARQFAAQNGMIKTFPKAWKRVVDSIIEEERQRMAEAVRAAGAPTFVVLSYKHRERGDVEFVINGNGVYESVFNRVTTRWTKDYINQHPRDFIIHSVARISDEVQFSVGDTVSTAMRRSSVITRIEVRNGECILFPDGENEGWNRVLLKNAQKVK